MTNNEIEQRISVFMSSDSLEEPQRRALLRLKMQAISLRLSDLKMDGYSEAEDHEYYTAAQIKRAVLKWSIHYGLVIETEAVGLDEHFLEDRKAAVHRASLPLIIRVVDVMTGEKLTFKWACGSTCRSHWAVEKAITTGFKSFVMTNFLVAENEGSKVPVIKRPEPETEVEAPATEPQYAKIVSLLTRTPKGMTPRKMSNLLNKYADVSLKAVSEKVEQRNLFHKEASAIIHVLDYAHRRIDLKQMRSMLERLENGATKGA